MVVAGNWRKFTLKDQKVIFCMIETERIEQKFESLSTLDHTLSRNCA